MTIRLTGMNLQGLSFGAGFTWEHVPDENSLEFSEIEADILKRLGPGNVFLVCGRIFVNSGSFQAQVSIGDEHLLDPEYYNAFLKLEYHNLLAETERDNIYILSHPGNVIAEKLRENENL